MLKLVSNQIIPHFTFADSLDAFVQIFGFGQKEIDFSRFLGTSNYLLTNSARTALSLIIEALELSQEKRIGIPAFICAVVATPFLQRGYKIEWIDTDENGVIDPEDFAKKSNKIGLVMVPHIFGQKAPIEKIYKIAREKNIFVVEDGAHYFEIPDKQFKSKNQKLPTYYDAKILSFGREKVVSCVSGGALIFPQDSVYAEKFKKAFLKLPEASFWWKFRHLCQPIIFALSLPWWNGGGKFIPYFFRKIGFLPLAVTLLEKEGKEDFPKYKMPRNFQKVLLAQFQNYSARNLHAKNISELWKGVLGNIFPKAKIMIPQNFFRVIVLNLKPMDFQKISQNRNFHLRDWDGVPIAPTGTNLQKFGYETGKCEHAEIFARDYLTFPTNIRTNPNDIKVFAQFMGNSYNKTE